MTTVVWKDAHSTTDELVRDDIRGRHRPNIIHTTGYIVVSDDVGVTIAGEWIPPDSGSDESFRNVTFIPLGMVIRMGVVKRAKKTTAGTDDSTVRGDTQGPEGSLRDVPPKANG